MNLNSQTTDNIPNSIVDAQSAIFRAKNYATVTGRKVGNKKFAERKLVAFLFGAAVCEHEFFYTLAFN